MAKTVLSPNTVNSLSPWRERVRVRGFSLLSLPGYLLFCFCEDYSPLFVIARNEATKQSHPLIPAKG